MTKKEIINALNNAGITFEIFWNKNDKDCNNYEVKLVKDKYTTLRAKLDFNITKEELDEVIDWFNKFNYKEYVKTLLHS